MVKKLIEEGLQRHRAGQLEEAKYLYEQALKLEPRHPDALHLAGLIALQRGNAETAVGLIQSAIAIQPENPGYHANLAQALLSAGRAGEARAAYCRAAALDPQQPQFAVGAANCLALQGDAAQAEHELRAVTQRYPGYALAWLNLGNAMREQGRHEEAAQLYSRAIELDPVLADAHHNLGSTLHQLERFEESEREYRHGLTLTPDYEAGHVNLASVLVDRGRFVEAATVCQHALRRFPGSAELQLQLGAACTHQGNLASALDAFRAACATAPDNPRAQWAYGYALVRTGKEAEGLPRLERAAALQSGSAEYRSALSTLYLSLGNLAAGWTEYQWRAARLNFLAEHPSMRCVDALADALSGARVCLLREQGLGDELFFLRYSAALKSRGAEITYCAHPKIAPLLQRVPTLAHVSPENSPPFTADLCVMLGDLPRALGALDYRPPLAIAPLPDRLALMTQRLAALGPRPYFGLTWRAGTAPTRQRGTGWSLHKAIPLEQLAGALRAGNGTFVALQRYPEVGEIDVLARLTGRPIHDLTALNDDLESMLALLALIDEYVGVSNTNMHLRAAAGRSARVLVPQPPEWRWMATGDESPWFPGFRIYRQGVNGEWGDALGRLATDLQALSGPRE